MGRRGWEIFSLAFAIAVPLSGIEGPVPIMLAWAAVLAGIGLLGRSMFRERLRSGARRRRKPGLDRRLERLGHDVLTFVRQRDAEASTGEAIPNGSFLNPLRLTREWLRIRAHHQDTMAIYRETFTPYVRSILRETLGVHLGHNEARRLLVPHVVSDLEIIGLRLIELGEEVRDGARSRQVA